MNKMSRQKFMSWILSRIAHPAGAADDKGAAGNAPADITRPFGKGRDATWRKSRNFLSHRSRGNRRKASRKAKAGHS